MKTFKKNKKNLNEFKEDSFSVLAKQIRLDKFDKREIMQIKNETMKMQRQKTIKNKSIIKIQSAIRGYFSRKKFTEIMQDYNIKTIIGYLNEKRSLRIKNNYQKITFYYIKKYLSFISLKKSKILSEYFAYCSDLIKATFKSYKVRKKIKPIRDLIKTQKNKICKAVLSYKIRFILRTNIIQNILVEIANIKYCLKNITTNDKLKEDFLQRMPKLELSFYETFYKIKENNSYINVSRTEEPWNLIYMSLIYKDNPKYTAMKTQLGNKTKSNKTFNIPVAIVNPPENNISSEHNLYNEYDNKPIKVKKIDYEHLFDNDNSLGGAIPISDNSNIPKKVIQPKKKEAKPKYDARKAIEEAKIKEAQEKENPTYNEKKKKRDEFRDFLREMKNLNKKGGKKNDIDVVVKEEPNISENKVLDSNVNYVSNSNPKDNEKEVPSKEKNIRKRKDPTVIEMRRKLHELERSPPPKLNLNKLKSRIACWGSPKKKRENNDSENINNTNNLNQNNQNLNIKRIKKPTTNSQNDQIKPLTFQQVEYEIVKKIKESGIYFKDKEDKMKNFKKIPFIKQESNFVKKFSIENYDNLLKELTNKYMEITNSANNNV